MDSPDDLIPDSQVARRYGIHIKTVGRWDTYSKLKFPPPVVINGRRYRRRRDLEEFERRQAVERAAYTHERQAVTETSPTDAA
jgi:hypothetical protein